MRRPSIVASAAVAVLVACGGGSSAPPASTDPTPRPTHVSTHGCSTALIRVVLEEQPDLPEPVAATRQQIFDAAIACDFDTLGELAGPGFTYSFGGGDDPAQAWRDAENANEPVMRTLVTLLNLESARGHGGGETDIHLWPAVFVTGEGWAAVEEAFGAEQAAAWRDPSGAYLGYRVGIDETGDWLFFVAGD